ncbi:hypothetical protein [Streptomyces malaysiensis]|uniref:Uncharacterized protein n=1 Tax=Streptomyces malaysiensis TaxID=92644 RepID=A0A7X6AZ64_STRMQ|nr:hypothetical protein [Streptomyces malaysiensis]NIY68109.1 hypothetical protein [Streptomyces malaysiensis]
MTDEWIEYPESADDLVQYLGKHIVAYPFAQETDKYGGQLVALDPQNHTASLRRYDTGEIMEFPWPTTKFRHRPIAESPYAELKVGDLRLFAWFHDADGHSLTEPITLVGTVDRITQDAVSLWVEDNRYEPSRGWWARLRAEDADKHALRPVDLKGPTKK